MERELEDKIALVTGASRGIGREISLLLARNGAHVALNYHSDDKSAEEIEAEVNKMGRKTVRIKCSVADYEAVEDMVKTVREKLGPIDILINNAGMLRDKFLINMNPQDWIDVINTNLIGVFNVTKIVAFSMIRRGKGKIVNIASLSAMLGAPGQTNYTASKGGVVSFTKSLSRELASFGINVNAVAPGYIETDMLKTIPEDTLSGYLKLIPLGRFGQAEDVANVALFLVSDKSKYITGQIISVDGGLL